VIFFGRGPGGKYYTALDVTSPGPFTRSAGQTNPPWVMWNRGNPDTVDGTPTGTQVRAQDFTPYSKMGETWSVPAVGNVGPTDFGNPDPTLGVVEFRAFTGSGYGTPASGEGATFYSLDALTGNVVQSRDLPGGLTNYIADNALVAGPSGFNPQQLEPPPLPCGDPNNPVTCPKGGLNLGRVTRVYTPDIQGRIWKFNTSTSDVFFDAGPEHPFGNSVSLLKITLPLQPAKGYVFAESGNDPRVPDSAGPFKLFGLRDDGGDLAIGPSVMTGGFPIDLPATPPSNVQYRGTSQPVTAYNAQGQPRVFFAATRFNPAGASSCLSSFDTIFFALGAVSGDAVYDFNADGTSDLYVEFANMRTTGLQTIGGSVYMGESGALGARPQPTPNPSPTPTPTPPTPPYIITMAQRSGGGSPVCRQP
jgi:hypothetical protein